VGLVYDVGGNTGVYSRLAADCGNFCVLYDSDALCVERAYLRESRPAAPTSCHSAWT